MTCEALARSGRYRHLHVSMFDYVGWNTKKVSDNVPTFPNAFYPMVEKEYGGATWRKILS